MRLPVTKPKTKGGLVHAMQSNGPHTQVLSMSEKRTGWLGRTRTCAPEKLLFRQVLRRCFGS